MMVNDGIRDSVVAGVGMLRYVGLSGGRRGEGLAGCGKWLQVMICPDK